MSEETPSPTPNPSPSQAEPAASPATGALPLSVLGPVGAVDLMVPRGATVADVTAEYARQAGLDDALRLQTELGRPLTGDTRPIAAVVTAGDVLVVPAAGRRGPRPSGRRASRRVGTATVDSRRTPQGSPSLVVGMAVVAADASAWCAARLGTSLSRTLTVNVLLVAAIVGLLPLGRLTRLRSAVSPVLGGAAAYVVMWQPGAATEPVTWGVAALAAAITAAVGRVLLTDDAGEGPGGAHDEAHLVWIAGGLLVFATSTAATLLGLDPPVVWVLLLVSGPLTTRFVPRWAVSVSDPPRIDRAIVVRMARRGRRLVFASSVATAVVTTGSTYLLLASHLAPVDRVGAWLLVLFAGGALLLSASGHRDLAVRRLLRAAGLSAWSLLALAALPGSGPTLRAWVLVAALAVAGACVVSAVAVGRGWRSLWWARRAEVAEACCGALAIASSSVACGLFRVVWQLTSR